MQFGTPSPRTGRDSVGGIPPGPFFARTHGRTPRLGAASAVLEVGRPRFKVGLPTRWVTLGGLPALQASCLICEGTNIADFTGDYEDEVKQAHQRAMSGPVFGTPSMGEP